MSKARSKGQKLAEKRRRQLAVAYKSGALDLAPVPRPKSRGRKRMAEIKVEKDADTPALQARCRQSGIKPDEAGLRQAKAPWLGCNAGRAMASVVSNEADRQSLWSAIQHMRKVQIAYGRAIGAPSRNAQCLRIMAPTEAMQADASSTPVDMRTEDERHRQAVSAWMQMQGWLGHADKVAASICKRVVIDDERCPDATAMVAALRCVEGGIAGRKILGRHT